MMRASQKVNEKVLENIFGQLVKNYPDDWLLVLEIYEILNSKSSTVFKNKVRSHLEESYHDEHVNQLIKDGIRLADQDTLN